MSLLQYYHFKSIQTLTTLLVKQQWSNSNVNERRAEVW